MFKFDEAFFSNFFITIINLLVLFFILKKLLFYGVPIIMVAGLQNAGGLVDTINVKSRLLSAGYSNAESRRLFGVLGYYNTLLNVPFALVTALSAAIFPKIIQAYIYFVKIKYQLLILINHLLEYKQ